MIPSLISVVIPVYNVESYLRECLDSLLAQDYTQWEALCVDDGSPDRCGEILDEYASRDSRFRVWHQANRGVSGARNVALDNAKGEYLFFLDADDMLPVGSLSTLASLIKDAGVDIAMGKVEEGGGVVLPSKVRRAFLDEETSVDATISPERLGMYNVQLGNCLFRRQSIADLRFDTDVHYSEDALFKVRAITSGHLSTAYTDDIVYHYRTNDNGASQTMYTKLDDKVRTNVVSLGRIYQIVIAEAYGLRTKFHTAVYVYSIYYRLAKYMGRIRTPDMMARHAAMQEDIRVMPSWLRCVLYVQCKFDDAWTFIINKCCTHS